jgi:heptosyltransferase-2
MTRSLFPDAEVDFLAIPAAKNILETNPDIHHLIIYDKHGKDKGAANLFRRVKELRKNRYDLALVPHRSIRSAALVSGANIPVRIGFDRSAGRFLFNRIIPYPYNAHEINRNLHLLAPFGVDVTKKVFPKLYFNAEDHQAIEKWLKDEGLTSSDKFIAIAPGSVWATKRWLPEYFAQTADSLASDGYKVILIGGPGDGEVAKTIAETMKTKVNNAVGRFSLRESALLIQHSRLLITNDSAPMHLSVSVETPVLAIFGPTVPAFGFYPYGERDRVAEIENLACRPCGKHGGDKCPIGTFVCMKQLLPAKILQDVQEILKKDDIRIDDELSENKR